MTENLVADDDTSIIASREGGTPRLHLEVASLLGQLRIKPVRAASGDSDVERRGSTRLVWGR